MKVEDLIPYINNPRNNENAVDKVASSISEFGFKNPIIIDKNNIVINGHTRLLASKKLGLKEVPVIRADDLTEAQVKAFRIADNKTSDLSVWNQNLIDKLKNFDSQLMNILNFDDKFLKKFEKIQKIKKQPIEFSEDDVILQSEQKILVSQNRKIKCPCCGRQFQL